MSGPSGDAPRGESAPQPHQQAGSSGDHQVPSLDEEARLPREVTRSRQFGAVLRKNYLLQTRSRRLWWSGAGWLALLVEVLVPVLFFGIMCIPKHYIKPQPLPRQVVSQAYELTSGLASKPGSVDYHGPARYSQSAKILYAPNDTASTAVMERFAQGAACPDDPAKKEALSTTFHRYFLQQGSPPSCADSTACMASPACWKPLMGSNLVGFSTEDEAVSHAVLYPQTVDAVVAFRTLLPANVSYAVRVNHTSVPPTQTLLNYFSPAPDRQYQMYWFFANVQQLVERAIIGGEAEAVGPAPIVASFKPFPWPAVHIDLGAAAAALAFTLLLVYAFLGPTRACVTAIVREKELRLREGMRILGLKDPAYWASWAINHWLVMAASGVLCAAVGTYPFSHSDPTVLLAFYWLVAAALIAYAYTLSTLFAKSRVAGTSTAVIYACSMIPGYLMPYLKPYGGVSWTVSCLLPPSSISLFASVLLKMEVAQQGLTWQSLGQSITPEYPFSARRVFLVVAADILLYAVLTAYLDQVLPSDVGRHQAPWFFLLPSYWRRRRRDEVGEKLLDQLLAATTADKGVAVAISDLRKTYTGATGVKQAVDGLDLDIYKGSITGLLGHNGAGKTTTISILTGMVAPTSGDAVINGMSIRNSMPAIRQHLGVCPQFDILWPDITVAEHLELYAAIKGFARKDVATVVDAAIRNVGLDDKASALAGDLSGGQRRKLSVAIAFLGSPDVVFLDEPTSGMDPYSRRLTWEIIKRHRSNRAIVLTTHSMEEADVLCDQIAILADGRLAALGSSLDLKTQFGAGYTLTVVRDSPPWSSRASSSTASGKGNDETTAAASDILAVMKRHVGSAEVISAAAGEASFRLPKEAAARFPALLRALDWNKASLGIRSYGISVTTMEEVFLQVSRQAAAKAAAAAKHAEEGTASSDIPVLENSATNGSNGLHLEEEEEEPAFDPPVLLASGASLYAQRVAALVVKRAVCARRDRLAVVTQLAVPIALVLAALWTDKAYVNLPNEPPISISRDVCFLGNPTALAASPAARAASNGSSLALMQRSYHDPPDLRRSRHHKQMISSYESNETELFSRPYFANTTGTLEGFLLDRWFSGNLTYDALFLQSLPPAAKGQLASGAVAYTALLNQTAIHGVPATLNAANNALLRAWTGHPNATIRLVNHPLPTLANEDTVKVNEMSGDLLMVLCVTMAAAVLSASFAVFLVREAESRSKHVQVVSGAPLTAFWGSTYLWDSLNFIVPVAGIILCFYAFDLPQFRGPRMAAVVILFLCFGAASLPLTYLLTFYFSDEMRALQVLNTFFFLTGYLGFLSTWIMDTIGTFVKNATLEWWNSTVKGGLRTASPHFVLARGLYDISQTYRVDQGLPNTNPFAWKVSGRMYMSCGIQAVVYMAATLVVDFGVGPVLIHLLRRYWRRLKAALRQQRHTSPDYSPLHPTDDEETGGVLPGEDEDVAAERRLIQSGSRDYQVLLDGIQKGYPRHHDHPPLKAVAGVWLGVGRGECFGLLGLNGAGKTTTFRILTGEVRADEGDAAICGRSVRGDLHGAQQHTGYCPQFDGLPGQMTGREVLVMYARLRGVLAGQTNSLSARLVARLGLEAHADKTCDSCSGGTRRKLAVAVALMASPQVVLMDEPSTGMDPAARHFLWSVLQRQVVQAGHTVVLTSHSMEECEALCTRIGIMASGRLSCLGSVQHLKNRFGVGYMLDMRVEASRRDEVVAMVARVSPQARLTLKGGGHVSFALPSEGLDLPTLFAQVEGSRGELGIQEYSLSQTTLEQVFVNLAEHEAEDREATAAAVDATAAAADAEEAASRQ